MNFKVNLFFHQIQPFWTPHPDSPETDWWGGLGGVIMEEDKLALKCIWGKIKCFKTTLMFFLMENRVGEDPPSQLIGKPHFFFKPPLNPPPRIGVRNLKAPPRANSSLLRPCLKSELTRGDLNTVLLRWPGVTQWPLGPLKSSHMICTGNRKCTQETEF